MRRLWAEGCGTGRGPAPHGARPGQTDRSVDAPIARDVEGLALLSRNANLSLEERRQALVLYRALRRVEELAKAGETNPERLRSAALFVLADEPAAVLEYIEIVDPDTLLPISSVAQGALVAVAAKFGNTRLIDNVLLPPQ